MGIYCTQADLTDYIEGLVIDNPAALEREIARAERDLDNLVFAVWPKATDPADRKIDPATLDDVETDDLKRAACAQVEYRLEMGPEHFVRAQRERVARRGVTLEGRLPAIGPKVWDELAGSTLNWQSTRTGGRGTVDPAAAGWRPYDDEC